MVLSQLTDAELIANFQDLVIDEREKLVLQLEHVVELDRRKLFFHYESLRSYLIEEHSLEEWRAERLIRAARMLKKFPALKSKLESGKLNLTLLEIGAGCAHREQLSDSELVEILEVISGMSCKTAKREIASRFPASIELARDRIRPITEDLSEVTFIAHQDLLDKLDEIRDLLAHSHPYIKMSELLHIIASDYRDRYHPEAKAKRAQEREAKNDEVLKRQSEVTEKPSETVASPTAAYFEGEEDQEDGRKVGKKENRVPSQSIVHELTRNEGYQCAYIDPVTRKRCLSMRALETDHKKSWASGGETVLSNLRWLCFHHHKRISFLEFGESSKYSKS